MLDVLRPSDEFQSPFEHVTYQSLGIDPAKFYEGKFAASASDPDYLADPRNKYDIEYSRLRFLVEHVKGGNVLDLGCGAGPFGATLKRRCGIDQIVGVDMDPKCVQIARQTYDRAEVMELKGQVPFPDAYFDTVFSVDFFGHIEFCQKNALIREIHRITKPGGLSVHIIESSELDYSQADPTDPDNPIMKYILQDGHIGVEPASHLCQRWGRYFTVTTLESAFIYPFFPIMAYAANRDFDPDFREIIQSFSPEQRRAAHICLGFVCDHLRMLARQIDPALLAPIDDSGTDGHQARQFAATQEQANNGQYAKWARRLLGRSCGLVYLVCRKDV
jgi:cyclopropane fatty-acyl-phospholipid synthase-like methyltransferase